mmetsp:Transcript_5956/g.6837  ORF Transcript_5956/g.6837 Transcript_5956/m.6837 type:complete len:109 (-) Transcript_5956:258-584(-)
MYNITSLFVSKSGKRSSDYSEYSSANQDIVRSSKDHVSHKRWTLVAAVEGRKTPSWLTQTPDSKEGAFASELIFYHLKCPFSMSSLVPQNSKIYSLFHACKSQWTFYC